MAQGSLIKMCSMLILILHLISAIRVQIERDPISAFELDQETWWINEKLGPGTDFSWKILLKLRCPNRMGFHGIIGVGTPPQKFKVLFDTGSADLWVPAQNCQTSTCAAHAAYDRQLSTTFRSLGENFDISYIKGKLSGRLCREVVTIGETIVKDQTVGLASYIAPGSFGNAKWDGILGLSVKKFSDFGHVTILERMYLTGLIEKPLFALHMQSETIGSIELGSYNPHFHVEEMRWVSLTSDSPTTLWEVDMRAVCIGDTCLNGRNSKVLIDSGSNFIMVPPSFLQTILDSIEARRVPELHNTYKIDCGRRGKLPKISFEMGGHSFVLSPYDYTRTDKDHGCLVSFMNFSAGDSMDGVKYWIIGDPFLRVYFSVFDLTEKRIGFAKARSLLQ